MRRRRALLVASACAALAVPRDAAAIDFRVRGEPLRLDLTESMFLSFHSSNGNTDPTDDNYGELLNRLNAQLAWRRFLFAVRFDSGAWVHTPQPGDAAGLPSGTYQGGVYVPTPNIVPGGNAYCSQVLNPSGFASASAYQAAVNGQHSTCVVGVDDPRLKHRFLGPGVVAYRGAVPVGSTAFYLEKISATYAGREVEATLGDFYVNLGRGLVLSIRKIDELGVDTTVTGGKLIVHKGDWSAIALAGFTNVQNIDQSRAQWINDPDDLIIAGHVGYRVAKKALIGANLVWGRPSCPSGLTCGDSDQRPFDFEYRLRPGLMLDAPRLTKWLGVYAEYARQQDKLGGKSGDADSRNLGNAIYGAANVYLGRVSLLLETKWYDHYLPWHSSSDPFGNLVYMVPPTLERVIVQLNDNTDILAGRLRADVRVGHALNVFASGELARSHPNPQTTLTLVDFYGGAEIRWNEGRSHLFPLVEFRNEHQDATAETRPRVEERLVAVEWDFTQDLWNRFSLESQGLVWFRKKPLENLDGSIDDNGWREGNAYVSLKWASKLAATFGYEFTTTAKEQSNTHNFFNGSLAWNVTPATSIGLFVGGNRPGLKCISGVCRDFPAFQGARLEIVLRL